MLLDADPAVAKTVSEDRPCDRVCGILTVFERNVLTAGDLCRQRVAFHGAGDEQALTLRLDNQGCEREVALMAQAGEIEDILRTGNQQRVEVPLLHRCSDRGSASGILGGREGRIPRLCTIAGILAFVESQPPSLSRIQDLLNTAIEASLSPLVFKDHS
jgi:hypothetical protein